MADPAVDLAAQIEDQRAEVQRELQEIDLLLQQVRTEADRHAARREAASERFTTLLDQGAAPASLREAHDQLMLQAQRAALMSSQLDVLEGKQKVLQRLAAGLEQAAAALGAGGASGPASTANGSTPAAGPEHARTVLAAQEELRRAIARQMHDGPAQSIANICLQAQVVERLFASDPEAAGRELAQLREMAQHALDATKTFIFDVRPMVLDDLGLVPTLRRATGERARRAGVVVTFESAGADRRLDAEIESSLFRIVDEALDGYLAAAPAEVRVRLNWTEERLAATVHSRPPEDAQAEPVVPADTASTEEVPAALAGLIRDQRAGREARAAALRQRYILSADLWQELDQRARSVGIELRQAEDGLRLEAVTRLPSAQEG